MQRFVSTFLGSVKCFCIFTFHTPEKSKQVSSNCLMSLSATRVRQVVVRAGGGVFLSNVRSIGGNHGVGGPCLEGVGLCEVVSRTVAGSARSRFTNRFHIKGQVPSQ